MALILPNTIQNDIPADGDKLGQNFATITDWANQEAITRDGNTAMVAPLLLSGAPTQPNQAATKAYVDGWAPIGSLWMWLGTANPAGGQWFLAQGQAISRTTYATLFALVGTKFGAGNGTTTFNLPDLRGRAPFGLNTGGSYGQTAIGQKFGTADSFVIAHTHTFSANTDNEPAHTHGLGTEKVLTHNQSNGSVYLRQENVTPMRVNNLLADTESAGGHAHTVSGTTGSTGGLGDNANIPPALAVNFIVKAL